MSTTDGWRRPRRVPDARAQGPRTPINPAKIGRSPVRRRARGMTHGEAAAALAEAELDAHLDRRHEEAAEHSHRRAAELAEWRRIGQLLAVTGGPYNLDDDVVVQEELAAEAAAAETREAQLREAAQVAARADPPLRAEFASGHHVPPPARSRSAPPPGRPMIHKGPVRPSGRASRRPGSPLPLPRL
ncbi:hypothetical protein ABZY34_25395 [Streptomyces virginiae]|uniref:hypothetical protein n=1 Tax=Streptomyces virginiae TaxID=1961 RepID=UPI0033BA9D8D